MIKTDQSSYATTGSAEEKPCPSSPPPDFDIPEVDSEDYYKKLPKYQIELRNVERDAKIAEADEKKEDSFAKAEERLQAATFAYEQVDGNSKEGLRSLDKRTKNKKITLRNEYRKSLRETLKRDYCAPGDIDIEKDDTVPKDQKAIIIAEFLLKLAIVNSDYLGDVQKIELNRSLAGNELKLAQKQRNADRCTATATEETAKRGADLERRRAISKDLEEANK